MSPKTAEEVIAETQALIDETIELERKNAELLASAQAEVAKMLNQDPASFDLQAYLKRSVAPAELDKLLAEAAQQVGAAASSSPQRAPASAQAAPARPHRRMV